VFWIRKHSSSEDKDLIPCWNAALNPEGDNKSASLCMVKRSRLFRK